MRAVISGGLSLILVTSAIAQSLAKETCKQAPCVITATKRWEVDGHLVQRGASLRPADELVQVLAAQPRRRSCLGDVSLVPLQEGVQVVVRVELVDVADAGQIHRHRRPPHSPTKTAASFR